MQGKFYICICICSSVHIYVCVGLYEKIGKDTHQCANMIGLAEEQVLLWMETKGHEQRIRGHGKMIKKGNEKKKAALSKKCEPHLCIYV